MSNTEQVKILQEKGFKEWNKWRINHNHEVLDLSHERFNGKIWYDQNEKNNASKAINLEDTDLSFTVFISLEMDSAKLSGANLNGANLSNANLKNADFQSKNNKKTTCHRTNFNNAKMQNTHLECVDFKGASFNNAKLNGAHLNGANFENTNLYDTDLSGADLSGVYLSGCFINLNTLKSNNIKGIQKGINGFYCEDTKSAAVIYNEKRGNSMQSPNADSVIENLKEAKKLIKIPLILAGIVFLIVMTASQNQPTKNIQISLLSQSFKINPSDFAIIGILFSIGIYELIASAMNSALNGIRILSDMESVTRIAQFPWIFSKYESHQKNWFRILRFTISLVHIVYPFMYLSIYWIDKHDLFNSIQCTLKQIAEKCYFINSNSDFDFISITYLMVNILIIPAYLYLSIINYRLFSISEEFQKPIYFDDKTEMKKKTEIQHISEMIEYVLRNKI